MTKLPQLRQYEGGLVAKEKTKKSGSFEVPLNMDASSVAESAEGAIVNTVREMMDGQVLNGVIGTNIYTDHKPTFIYYYKAG